MAMARIAPYALPDPSELPENRVAWTPDPARAALLVHDMQNYFVDAYEPDRAPMTEVIPRIDALRRACARVGVPVVFSAQPPAQAPEDRMLLQDFWGSGIGAGPREHRIIDALAPAEDDVVLTKWRYSAFQRTDLRERLHAMGRDQLIITGIYANIGCLMTACEAFMQDVQAFFVGDAMADLSLDEHRLALRWAAQRCAVTTTAERVTAQLGAGSAPSSAARRAGEPVRVGA
jgi:bifunctional isochorismate lyase/aryl carrier protein